MLRVLGFDGILQSKQAWISDDQALRLMERAAAKDHVPALVELGNCYYSGRWVAQDHQRAVAHWEKGLALGSADARVRVAIMNVREEKSAAVVGLSVEELEKALKNGSVLAQVALGYCYEKGIGVPLEKGEAASLYRGAAQRGSQDAFRALKRLHDELRPSGKEFHVEE
jgi:TPR repeat protein